MLFFILLDFGLLARPRKYSGSYNVGSCDPNRWMHESRWDQRPYWLDLPGVRREEVTIMVRLEEVANRIFASS